MSKAKPTPEPWELRGWSIKHPGNGHRICVVDQPDKGLRQFGGGDYDEMLAECRANAELLLNAPRLAAENAALRSQLAEEQERHAQLQARCFDQGSQSVFDAVREARERLAEANALLREAAAWRTAVECIAPEIGGLIMTLARIDAHLAREEKP